MKILYAGQLAFGQTCRMRRDELELLGNELIDFDTESIWRRVPWLSVRLQKKFGDGPSIRELNQRILALAEQHRPDWFWGDKLEYVYPSTLKRLQTLKIRTIHFTPDPYFTLAWKRTKLTDGCMPLFDCVITSKAYELEEYRRTCRKVIYMPLGFSELVHRPLHTSETAPGGKFATPIGFLGGWEPRREEYLTRLAQAGGRLKLWGFAWDHLVDGRWTFRRYKRLKTLAGSTRFKINVNPDLAPCVQGGEVYGDEYAQALTGTEISIGFLRLVCPDQHTTRTFEIPACGSMLLADRTPEHQEFFQEGVEAEYFSSADEMVEKACYYQEHEGERKAIADAGLRRCHQSGYSYRARLQQVLKDLV